MSELRHTITILMAEDDDDDFVLAQDAFTEYHLANEVRRVHDGEELMDYLLHRNAYAETDSAPWPSLILLDLNMPRKDGREVLSEIKAHAELRRIPVVVLTTSHIEEDIINTYELGVSSYIRKPVTFDQLCETVRVFKQYWFEIVELPPANTRP